MHAVCLGIERTRRIRVPAALACGALMAVCILLISCSSSPSPVATPGARGDFQRGREAYEKGRHLRAIELLEDFGIPVNLVMHAPPSVYPIAVDGLAEVRIMVRSRDLRKSRQIIADYFEEPCEE